MNFPFQYYIGSSALLISLVTKCFSLVPSLLPINILTSISFPPDVSPEKPSHFFFQFSIILSRLLSHFHFSILCVFFLHNVSRFSPFFQCFISLNFPFFLFEKHFAVLIFSAPVSLHFFLDFSRFSSTFFPPTRFVSLQVSFAIF